MKKYLLRNLFVSVCLLTGFVLSAQSHLNAWFVPCPKDVTPGMDSRAHYSLYLTERGDNTLAEIKATLMETSSLVADTSHDVPTTSILQSFNPLILPSSSSFPFPAGPWR